MINLQVMEDIFAQNLASALLPSALIVCKTFQGNLQESTVSASKLQVIVEKSFRVATAILFACKCNFSSVAIAAYGLQP